WAQLLQHVAQGQLARSIDDQAHGTVLVVFDQVDQAARKIRIGHVWHGDQKVILEVGAVHAASVKLPAAGIKPRRGYWLLRRSPRSNRQVRMISRRSNSDRS